jgi:hypothetical protein
VDFGKGKDVMCKMRHIMNILKKTLGTFLITGADMSLDEASCASRSNYGREVIFFHLCLDFLVSHFEGRDKER